MTRKSTSKSANKMWGGRFQSSPAKIMEEINASIGFDKVLASEDIRGSKAHAAMLAECGIISKKDAREIKTGLDTIASEIETGAFEFSRALEDVHMNIESRLSELIGPAAGRLHTARSRNDQIATDFKLHVRMRIDGFLAGLGQLQLALARKAEAHFDCIMPGFTHLQPAQPVTFGHYMLAYVEMIGRDRSRLKDARVRLNECPLGSAALAGTSFPIDRHMTAAQLDFSRPTANSIDAVADRDFVLETLSATSISAMHLSRMAEEIVIWTTPQFNFLKLSDKFTTGSSIMPQKRNPDAAELVRAKIGRIAGAYQAVLMVMKGLPLTYAKDMQEDKEVTLDAFASFELAIAAMHGMVADMEPNRDVLSAAAGAGYSTATDLADWLVRELKMPFRDAHHVTGRIVSLAEKKNLDLDKLQLQDMQSIEPKINKTLFKVLSPVNSAKSRTSYGGTAPANVRKMARIWIKKLEKELA